MNLRIYEIFFSIQGESSRVGLPTVFIRLTGCPLRCGYCDTEYAFSGGTNKSFDEILSEVRQYKTSYICVTGGEPLAQKASIGLLKLLCDNGYSVSLETSGAMDISEVDQSVSVIMDIKTPGSGESAKNLWSNLKLLKEKDEVKFVLCNREDYEWSRDVITKSISKEKCNILFSPAYNQLNPAELAEWILQDNLPVRMQIQMHKVLWGEKPGV